MDNSAVVQDQEPAESAMYDSTKKAICHSISEGSFMAKFWRAHTDKEWTAKGESNNNDNENEKTEDDVSGVSLKGNIRLILSPSSNRGRRSRNRNGLSDTTTTSMAITRFHKDLKTDDLDGMVVIFQAKAEKSISVILSPWPSIDEILSVEDKEDVSTAPEAPSAAATRYEIVLGANNNTATTIRKVICGTNVNTNNTKKKPEGDSFVTIPSRVCRGLGGDIAADGDDDDNSNETSTCWTSYWICLSNSRLYVGMGRVPGKECFGVLKEEGQQLEQQQQQQEEASTKIETATEDDRDMGNNKDLQIRYVGIGNNSAVQKNKDSIVGIQNLVVTNVPPCLESLLKNIPSQDDLPIMCLAPAVASSSGMDIDEDAETLELKKGMENYKAECLVRKKRAMKYGTDYKVQPMKDFLPWTMAKRLQGKQRLGSRSSSSTFSSGFVAGDIDFLDPKEISKRDARLARFAAISNSDGDGDEKPEDGIDETGGENGTKALSIVPSTDGVPVGQAWDKEGMLRPIRRDPPPYLWKESPSNLDTLKIAKAPDPFSMYDECTKAATWIADKLHISSIDWAAFKQIRNDDLIKHLEAYGPIKYIEWLGDVSCNVCFANKASASRALVCLSNELPSPPPAAATAEVKAEEDPEPPTVAAAATLNTNIDLGSMTWRFGKRPIRKVSNDRHGKRGTTARYLLRVATTEDVLIERPNSWPEPPGGFASDRVLGPKSDYVSAKNKTKTKQNHRQQQQQQQNRRGGNSKQKRGRRENNDNNNKHGKNERKKKNSNNKTSNPIDLLDRGLSSNRGGFSVEEMEKERQAKKRQKTC